MVFHGGATQPRRETNSERLWRPNAGATEASLKRHNFSSVHVFNSTTIYGGLNWPPVLGALQADRRASIGLQLQ